MAEPVTWFEIMGKDSARLQKFYADLFNWKLSPPVKEMGNYSMLPDPKPGPGIAGGIGEGDARMSIYIEVAEPQRFVDKAVATGARLIMPVTEITPGTTIAMLVDPAGNTFGLTKARPAEPRTTARRTAAKKPAARARKKTTTSARKRTATRRSGTRRASTRRRR